MMKAIVKFYDNCVRLVSSSAQDKGEKKITMGFIEQTLGGENDVIGKINNMKFVLPSTPEVEVRKFFDDLHAEIDTRFSQLRY